MAGEPITSLTPAPTITVIAPTPIAAGIHTQPSFDVIELLPPAAQERLRQLRQRSDDLHAITVPHADLQAASMARIEAENALRRLTSHPHAHGFNLKAGDQRVIAATRTLEKAEAEFLRLQERQTSRAAQWQASARVVSAVEGWLRDGRPSGTVLEDWDGPAPQLLKGEKGLLDAVENRRRRGRELRATLHTIRSAPMPSSWAKAQMRAQIEALAMQGTPSTALLIEHGGKIEFQTQRLQSEVYNAQPGAVAYAEVPDVVGLLTWALKDALIKKLDAEIDGEADDAAALGHEERQRREAEVMDDLLATERTEAALVWRAMDEKLPVEHRHDCSPQAILQVALITAPRAIDGPSTTPLAYDIVLGGRR
jgi:hypothetical protein